MGLRFRKSVKILPGVKVNLSGSGVSVTVGPRGFTHTIGKNGIYRNLSLPGTGIYSREKVADLPGSKGKGGSGSGSRGNSGRSTKRLTSVGTTTSRAPSVPAAVREWRAYTGESDPQVTIDISPEGTVTLLDARDQAITDPTLISIIKRTPQYREQMPVLREQHRAEVAAVVAEHAAANDAVIKICRRSPQVLARSDFEKALEDLEQGRFDLSEPEPTAAPEQSPVEAPAPAPTPASKPASKYLDRELARQFDEELRQWEATHATAAPEPTPASAPVTEADQELVDQLKQACQMALDGDEDYVESVAEEWMSRCDIPLEIFTQFEYREQEHCLMVDLDLPEIEDLPGQVATQLANGDLRTKDKSQTQLRREYAECVFGLAVYVAANLLNISPAIEEVVVSGYTQRRDRAGDLVDDYLFSVRFPRWALDGVDFEAMDPEEFCLGLESRCSMTATKVFRAIEPYE